MPTPRSFCALFLLLSPLASPAQQEPVPRIEPSTCIYQAAAPFKTRCGYLIVPESRAHSNGTTIKLPFIYVESSNPAKLPDPVLFTGGGPGLSSLHPVTSIDRRALLHNRDYIAFEQRGTHFAKPNLECPGLGLAIQHAYLHHTSPDEVVSATIRPCRANLTHQGIDLSDYNTDESAADIEDLRRLLHIDSLNLMGISYSGGLMMAVLQKYPTHIRSLILDSPLPEFINIDEQELANFNDVLTSVLSPADPTLPARFHTYFTSIDHKVFTLPYTLTNGQTVTLNYGRNEMLAILKAKLEDYDGVHELPRIVTDMISGHHEPYLKTYFDGAFSNTGAVSGMRLSVYCSDKMAYADPAIIGEQDTILPWLAGFHVNDVYQASCTIWHVKPISPTTKKTFYSNVPILLGAGQLDDSCRPLYNDMIHHYFPNSQRLLFTKRQHAPLLNSMEGDLYMAAFLDQPFKPLAGQKDIEAY